MTKLIHKYLNHYYWFFLLLPICDIVGVRYLAEMLILINIGVFVMTFRTIKKIKAVDIFIVLFILYALLSTTFSDYPGALAYYGIKGEITPMLFFFIARGKWISSNEMAQGMRNPIILAILIGIVLFVWRPGWYMDYIIDPDEEFSTNTMFLKNFQFKSVWPSTYGIAYSTMLLAIFTISKRYVYNIKDKFDTIVIILCIVSVLWSLQRVCMAFLALYLVYQLFYAVKHRRATKKLFFAFFMIVALVAIGVYYVMNYALDETGLGFLLDRFSGSGAGKVSDRVGLFDTLFKYVSFFGNGLGRFGHAALLYNMDSVTDCEYLRYLCEVGVVGTAIFAVILLMSLARGLKYLNTYFYETMVLCFYMFAMIGAAPMESTPMQNFFFWFCLGLLHNDNLIKKSRQGRGTHVMLK